jgi:hypothetical protein
LTGEIRAIVAHHDPPKRDWQMTSQDRVSDLCNRREFLARTGVVASAAALTSDLSRLLEPKPVADAHLLYVAEPGIRNYVEWGGIGVLVYDARNNFKLLRRIPTLVPGAGEQPEPMKGICASAKTNRLYVTTPKRLIAIDLLTERVVWNRAYDQGCDRMAITPDGSTIYLPSFEGPVWTVLDARTGDVITVLETKSGAHNTICGPSGTRAYLAGLRSPLLRVADTRSRAVASTVGPFSNVIRPFTIDGSETRCFVNVNELLGFEIGDLRTGKMLHRVEVPGFQPGPVKRHGCPSHGIGMTPDESEIWVSDGANSRMHVFDATRTPPRLVQSIPLRDQPGWVTFTIDGRFAIPSTGEVVDVRSKRIVAALADESGKPVQSEKLLEMVFSDGKPMHAGDQFGIGGRR